jgi:ankyrin repeat protein
MDILKTISLSIILIISIAPLSLYSMDIFKATAHGDCQRIQELIAANTNVNQQNTAGYTPLHIAVYNGCHAAKCKAPHWQNYAVIIHALLDAHANVDARTFQNQETPLHLATKANNLLFVKTLINAHADVNATTTDLQTPLHLAAHEGYSEVVQALIQAQAFVNPRSSSRLTPLHMACSQGHQYAAFLLLLASADIEAENTERLRPLHLAIINNHEQITEALIAAHADINAQTRDGITPLHLAAKNNSLSILHILVRAGADQTIKTIRGRTAINVTSNQSIITYLTKTPTLYAELVDAVHRHDLASVLLLIALGAPICKQDTFGSTPIHDAIDAYDQSNPTVLDCIARELINATRVQGLHLYNKAGQSPLHIAAMRGNVWIAKLLLNYGANPNTRDLKGNTPLHYASSPLIRNKLLSHGADTSLVNFSGQTPLSNTLIWQSIWSQ